MRQDHREGSLDAGHRSADRRPRQRRQDVRGGRLSVHRTHHQSGSIPGHRSGRLQAARRQTGRHRADHAPDSGSASAGSNDRHFPFSLLKEKGSKKKSVRFAAFFRW